MKIFLQALGFFAGITILVGIIYPCVVTLIAPCSGDKNLISKATSDPKLFWSRPSPASNLGPTSEALSVQIKQRRELLGKDAPIDLLTASGSGLDPHISPEAARFQIARIARERNMSEAQLKTLVEQVTEGPQWGFMGQPRVNVIKLNRELNHD